MPKALSAKMGREQSGTSQAVTENGLYLIHSLELSKRLVHIALILE